MKAIIIFHSVCGNTYLLAEEYKKSLAMNNVEVDMFRVEDNNFEVFANMFPAGQETKNRILDVPILDDPAKIKEYDLIIMGSPTYFGTVSGPMKMFMDKFIVLFLGCELAGKKFTSFATASSATGGADMCLLTLNNFAMHLGMNIMSIPANTKGNPQPAYGITHIAGGDSTIRPDDGTKESINDIITRIIK